MFETKIDKIITKIQAIDPIKYARTRNFKDGSVSMLSPYISRGVISTKSVLDSILTRNHKFHEIEKFVMELAWREYFQNVWLAAGDEINDDLKQPQPDVQNSRMPSAIINAETGIEAIDRGINDLYETGYVHNHQRMYIASAACNIGKSHWKIPAQWLYFYLLDADWASNALSWQWTAAAFSNKKYYANQENINKYCGTDQHATFLDVDYSEFPDLEIPEVLKEIETPILETVLPEKTKIEINNSLPTIVYNFYNLDPFWKKDVQANRVLLLESSHFEKYPISSKTIDFILELAKNIDGIQIYTGEFDELKNEHNLSEIYFKEHPTNTNYKGNEEPRDWMFPEIKGYFPSFFNYWKKCEKLVKNQNRLR
jgi:deoxyribodipyrimidine photo-lyase